MRSAVTNGSKLLLDGSGTSAWSRRYADLIAGHASDMGGPEMLSEAQLSLIRRAATLEVALESLEARLSRGEQISLDEYGRASSHLRRILECLGLSRKQRDLAIDPLDYARSVDRDHLDDEDTES